MKQILGSILVILAFMLEVSSARAQTGAREAGYLYLSPKPGAPYVSMQTRYLLVRFENVTPAEVTNLANFLTVTGANSGAHAGTIRVASDGRTVVFEVSEGFTQIELVTVAMSPQLAPSVNGVLDPYEYQFMIMAPMSGSPPFAGNQTTSAAPMKSPATGEYHFDEPVNYPVPAEGSSLVAAVINPNGVSVPKDFPTVMISVNNNPSPGYLFLETGVSGDAKYTMMLGNDGQPVWYRRGRMWDFKIQKNGSITWCLQHGAGFPSFDENFNYLKTYTTTNGYLTDGHDLKVFEDGSYLMLGSRVHTADLRSYVPGGGTNVTVTETVLQQFTAASELIFQWRSWDHYDIGLSGADFPHLNAVNIDEDGHILISARHLNEVTKIDRDTGEIIWRLSGANSSFTFPDDPLNGFSFQHDISPLGNGHYMVFDNGNAHSPRESRAVEYQLDLTNMTASMVWQFRDTPSKYAYWQGNAQRLPSGNTLINFVLQGYPKAIEVDTNGVKRFELSIVPNSDAYRAFRFPWNGVVAAPYLILEPQPGNIALIFNKFGDTNVAYYRIYGGTSPSPTNLVATSTTTLKHLTNVVNGVQNYFRVTAVSNEGLESGYSNEEGILVNLSPPGQNMVLNGDFSLGAAPWIWQVTPPASAAWGVVGGTAHFTIASGGIYITDVQLKQSGMKLTQGRDYTFAFDAWSAAPRIFEAKVEEDTTAGVVYSGIQPFFITPVTNRYEFQFTMVNPTDNNARVVFNAGALPHDVYIANVSLEEHAPPSGDFDLDGCVEYTDLKILTGSWQKYENNMTADLNKDGTVNFIDFALFAEGWTSGGFCP